jgi:hypothetical protein
VSRAIREAEAVLAVVPISFVIPGGGQVDLDHPEAEPTQLRDAMQVLRPERHVRRKRRRADADGVAGAKGRRADERLHGFSIAHLRY